MNGKRHFMKQLITLIFGACALFASPLGAANNCDHLADKLLSDKPKERAVISSCEESAYYNAAVAQLYLNDKSYELARRYFYGASEIDKDYLVNLSGAYFDQYLEDKDVAFLDKADKIVSDALRNTDGADQNRLKGMILYHKGLYEQAESHLLKSIRLAPSAYAYEQLALVHFKKGCFSCVIGDLEQGSIVEPTVLAAESYMYLGVAAFVELRRYDDACNTLALLLEHNSDADKSPRYSNAVKLLADKITSDPARDKFRGCIERSVTGDAKAGDR